MGKQAFDRSKPHVNIGTIGHVDHGKTSLTAAITNVLSKTGKATAKAYADIDAAPEEKARGDHDQHGPRRVRDGRAPLRSRGLPGPRRLHQEHDHGAAQMDGAILVVSAGDGPMPQTREHILLARQVGVPSIVVFLNKADMVDDPELIELVELEVRELLSKYEFPGDDVPIIVGSAVKALEGDQSEIGEPSVLRLMEAVDSFIPTPERDVDKPFLMPVEDTMTITGRGTVATGRVERGVLKAGDQIEIVGIRESTKSTIATSMEMFRKTLTNVQAGGQRWDPPAGRRAQGHRARSGAGEAGEHQASHEVRGRGVHPEQGGGRAPHAFLQGLPPPVLLPYDGRDGEPGPARGGGDGDAG